uniref:Uncharacterized protein n=1 Tax=Arundo donax TaxID=35708 RepID=A0A0A9NEI7_ARUDO
MLLSFLLLLFVLLVRNGRSLFSNFCVLFCSSSWWEHEHGRAHRLCKNGIDRRVKISFLLPWLQ